MDIGALWLPDTRLTLYWLRRAAFPLQVKPGGMLDPSKIIGGLQNKPNKQPMQGQQQQQQPFGAPSGYGAPALGGVQQQHQTYNPSQQQQGSLHGGYAAAGGAAGAAGEYMKLPGARTCAHPES